MATANITELQLLEAIRLIPKEHWGELLQLLNSWQPALATGAEPPIRTGTDLAGLPLMGIWADREDIADSQQFAQSLRQQAEHRGGRIDAAGY